jgi:hypothetical protein
VFDMSATGRGAERRADDFYKTQPKTTRAILPFVLPVRGRVLEPSAGDGAIIEELIAAGVPSTEIDAFEINRKRADTSGAVCADFLEQTPDPMYGLVITNPPFVDAMEFAQHGVKFLRPGGTLALLTRLNWLASQKRRDWLRQNTPSVHVLPERPEFVASLSCKMKKERGCKWKITLPLEAERPKRCPLCDAGVSCSTTDATDYAWMTWTVRPDLTRPSCAPFVSATVRILEVSP